MFVNLVRETDEVVLGADPGQQCHLFTRAHVARRVVRPGASRSLVQMLPSTQATGARYFRSEEE